MALIQCPECKHQVSDQAKACPNCGFGLQTNQIVDPLTPSSSSSPKKWGCLQILLVIVVLGFVIQLCESDDSNSKNSYTSSSRQSQTTSLGTGKITTIADGTDVGKVNIWSSASSNRSVKCSLSNNTRVRIIRSDGPYYLVESSSGCRGYCMKGFVTRN